MTMPFVPPRPLPVTPVAGGLRVEPLVAALALGLTTLGLFARIMAYPLRHDEQMYLPVGALLSEGDLYRDFGFNNLPNLPLLLHAVFTVTGADHYLLAGRLVIFAGWLLAALALAMLVRRASGSAVAALVAVLVLMTNPTLIGAAGMLVTNNFLPIPFAVLGTGMFIAALDRNEPNFAGLVASGFLLAIAAGFKANYIFLLPPFALAVVLLPRRMPLAYRLRAVALPLIIGGIAGAIPVLAYALADPDGFLAHVVRYHRGPHLAFWLANPVLDGPKVMSLGGKAQLAESIWLGGANLLILLACIYLAMIGGLRRSAAPLWPVLLVAGLVVGAAVVSFVPTPAFPQYYVAPIPFGIALVALLHGRLDAHRRGMAAPLLLAAGAILLVTGAPRLVAALPDLARPGRWTGNQVHAAGADIAAIALQGGAGPLATLAPIHALEAGLPVYPELAAGPLVYRVGDLIPVGDRQYYRMVSPMTIDRLLTRRPPAAVLVGYEGALDAPLQAFAERNGYRRVALSSLRNRYGDGVLFVHPQATRHE